MDPLTQAFLGASFAASCAKPKQIKYAALFGAVAGMAPDLDILISAKENPLLSIEFHRHFTHSLFFVPFGALIIALFLFLFFKTKQKFINIYFFSFLGYLSHGLLDACTSYGTKLFWPFSSAPISWNLISIIDPIFSLSLIVFLILSLRKKNNKYIIIGLAICALYLAFGYLKKQNIYKALDKFASAKGHKIEKFIIHPTIFNNILWRSIYQYNGNYYVNAAHIWFFNAKIHHKTAITPVVNPKTIFAEIDKNSVQRKDIIKFAFFSQDYINYNPQKPYILSDIRYSILPNSLQPLWGIKIDPQNPDNHVDFLNFRDISEEDYQIFGHMLLGKDF